MERTGKEKVKIRLFTAAIISAFFVMVFFAPQEAYASTDIRVLIGSEAESVSCTIYKGDYSITDLGLNLSMEEVKKGDVIKVTRIGSKYMVKVNNDEVGTAVGTVCIQPEDADEGVFTYSSSHFRGTLNLPMGTSGILPVNVCDIEYYLYGVVGNEIGYNIEEEALKAQAVASRSYALSCVLSNVNYDIKNTNYSQTYGGYNAESVTGAASVKEAVDDTKGEVIYYKNPSTGKSVIVKAYFCANSGGHTEDIENVWSGSAAYPMSGVPSPYDSYAVDYSKTSGQTWQLKQYQWQVQYSPAEIVTLAKNYSGKDIGTFKEIKTYNESASGRVTKIEIIGTKNTVTALKDAVRSALGNLNSTLFEIINSSLPFIKGIDESIAQAEDVDQLYVVGVDGNPVQINGTKDSYFVISATGTVELSKTSSSDDIIINGMGTGHGVGMSQWGARGMANAGNTYEKIIAHYYFGDPVNKNFYIGSINDD